MPKITIPITVRSRRYGYIYWSAKTDERIEAFLGSKESARLMFQGADHGLKKIDYKYRRISIGWKWTRQLPESVEDFVLSWKDNKTLDVVCR